MSSIPSLSAMRAFEATARLLSFTRAGDELGMTQAAVSWQVKTLEQRLGTHLFERRRSGLVLTATGRDLLPEIAQALGRLEAAFKGVGRSNAQSTLRITSSPTFAHAWLAPRLGEFHARHPHLTTQIDASPDVIDIAAGAADVAVRRGRGTWPGLTSHRLMPVTLVPMCAPALVGDHAQLSVRDIIHLPLLQPIGIWRAWLDHVGADGMLLADRPTARYFNQHMVIQAALSGQGVALLHPVFCADALAAGLLVRVHDEAFVSAEDGYWVAYREGSTSRPAMMFRDWLLQAARIVHDPDANGRSLAVRPA